DHLPPSPDDAITAQPHGPEPHYGWVVPTHRRGWPVLAWLVIVGIVGLSVGRANLRNPEERTATLQKQQSRVDDLQFRYLVGAGEMLKGLNQDIAAQAKDLKNGSIDKQLRLVVLVGELKGPTDALSQLRQVDRDAMTKDQERVANDLAYLYSQYAQ